MIGMRPTAFLLALALAAGPATGADVAQDYPPRPGEDVYVSPLSRRRWPAFRSARKAPAPTRSSRRTAAPLPPHGAAARIKDIAQLQSARDNQLVGYGLVIGLQGSGDSLRNSPFTEQSIRAMLENLGIASEGGRARAKNVAAVIVTANLPPFVKSGARIDVSVSSLGDATSLAGGTLVMTPMKAADGEIYAVAQGPVFISGFNAEGEAETLTQGVPTAGRIPNGAIIEREVEASFANQSNLVLQLRNADFSTAVRVDRRHQRLFRPALRQARRARTGFAHHHHQEAGQHLARALLRRARKPRRRGRRAGARRRRRAHRHHRHRQRRAHLARRHQPRHAHRAGSREAPRVVQPEPFSDGETAIEPYTEIEADQPDAKVAVLDGPDLETLVSGLNRLGVKPDGIIAILQGIKSAGAMQADLVLQ